MSLWLIPHIILMIILILFLVYCFGIEDFPFKGFMLLTIFCALIIVLAKCYGIVSTNVEEYLLGNKFEYLGKCFMPLFAFIFISRYYRVNIPRWVTHLLVSVNAMFYALIASNEHHYLYYSYVSPVREPGALDYDLGHGPFYYAYMVVLVFMLFSYLAVCIYHYFSEGKVHKDPAMQLIMVVGGILPFAGMAMFLTGITAGTDTTPLGIGAAAAVMAFSVVRYGLFDAVVFAKDAALENTETGVIVFDKYRKFLYANEVAKSIFADVDFSKATVEGYEIESLFATPGRILERGERSYEVRTSEILQNRRLQGYMAYFVDVTDHYYRLIEMEELKKKAEESASSKTMFLANMAHEIRTPMNAITGMTEVALEKDMSEELRGDLEMIMAAGESLLTTVNDVLDVSKMESGKFEITNGEYEITRLIQEVHVMLLGKAKDKNLVLDFDIEESMPRTLYGDDIRIKQILINLVNNAIKYTDEGRVTLSARAHRKQAADEISLEFAVTDTGRGIKAEDLDRIFGSFEQTDAVRNRKIEGTGLGLSICKQLVSLMKGTIGVESEYGKGSRFYFEIPQTVVDDTPIGKLEWKEKTADEGQFLSAKVLVIDDNRVNLTVAEGLFGKLGLKVDVAPSGKEAVKMAELLTYDMVFIDRMMPDMDGIETAKALRAIGDAYSKTPFVAFSADISPTSRKELDNVGFADYVEKPVRLDALKLVLERWLKLEDK